MFSILFICHGNICRSPMAEFIMKNMVKKAGLEKNFIINSAATSTEEIYRGCGNPIYPPAQSVLKKHGIPFDDHSAVQATREDYEKYDLLVCMDKMNVRNLMNIIGADPEGKCHRLMEFAELLEDVPDPWYTDDYDGVFDMISLGCRCLMENVLIKLRS